MPLKKIILILTSILILENHADAQNGVLEIGMNSGPSINMMRGNDIIKQLHKPALGFSAGFTLRYQLKSRILFQTRFAMERKGSLISGPAFDFNGNPIGTITTHNNFDYLTFPAQIGVKFGKKNQYFAAIGPYLGYLLQQTEITTSGSNNRVVNNNTTRFQHFDVGASVGIGASFPLNSVLSATVGLQNNLGLYNISKLPVINDGTNKTNSINILLGLAYKIN